MKVKFLLPFILLFLYALNTYSAAKDKYVSIQQLLPKSGLKIKLNGKGGYQGYCMEMHIANNTADTCFAWVEAGRRLESKDEKQQDIFIVRNAYVAIPPRSKKKFDLFGFCCISHNASPVKGSVFFIGKMEAQDWQSLAKTIDAGNFDNSAIQSAVWAISNNHPVSSIDKGKDNKNILLLKTVAALRHEELPWYNMNYKSEVNSVFTNKPSHIYAEINYTLAYYGEVTYVVKDRYGIVQTTLLEDIPKNKGLNTYFLDLDVAGWKDGIYYLELVQDGNKIIDKRKFVINTQVH